MLGLGAAAFGSSPFGSGGIETGSDPAVITGGCRYLGAGTRDYEADPNTGCYRQMPPTRQRVLLALATIQGSSTAIPRAGIRRPVKMDETFVADTQASVREALAHLVAEGTIFIEDIIVEKGRAGRSLTTVVYEDLLLGNQDAVQLLQ